MQNAFTTIDAVEKWMDGNKYYAWTLYGSDGKTILSTNYETIDPVESKKRLRNELTSRSQYGGSFNLYINDKKGSGGNWSPVVISHASVNGMGEGINGMVSPYGGGAVQGYHGIGSIKEYLEDQKKLWKLERDVEDLTNAQSSTEKFWQRQVENHVNHPDYDPNVTTMAIGGILSKVVNIAEILLGVNGADGDQSQPKQNYNYQKKPKTENDSSINGTHQQQADNTEGGDNEEDGDEPTYDGDKIAVVCDDLTVMFPNHSPEDILLKMNELLKGDRAIQGIVKKKLKL
jgi:hypothetical protein